MLLVKSPNHMRWDDASTAAVTEFAAEQGVSFVDFFDYDDFTVSDYSSTTGRLNVYGMKRFTEHLCDYILTNYSITPHELSAENQAEWDDCVDYLHSKANEKGMTIDEGQIYWVFNEQTGIRLLWNRCLDGTSYTVWRCEGESGTFESIATVTEPTYLDESVLPGVGYTYKIVPEDGAMQGTESNEAYYVFLDAPLYGFARNDDGSVRLSWGATEATDRYQIQWKDWKDIGYKTLVDVEALGYVDSDCTSGSVYDYRIRGMLEEGGTTYYSASILLTAIPVTTPQITSVSAGDGVNKIRWSAISKGSEYNIYRRTEYESEFTLYDTCAASATSYSDEAVESGVEYLYRIVLTQSQGGVQGKSDPSNTVGVIAR